MSYQNYHWTHAANDTNSPYFRNYIWTKAFYHYPKLLKVSRLVVGMTSRNNQAEYIDNAPSWKKCHQELRAKVEKDYHIIEWILHETYRLGAEFNQWTEKNIFNAEVTKLSAQEISNLINQFVEKQSILYAFGVAIPILDFQEFAFIENTLKNFINNKIKDKNKQTEYFSIFTTPLKNSFSQDQEEDLLKLTAKFYEDKEWKNDILTKPMQELKLLHPEFYQQLQEHTGKYAWVYYVYSGPAYTEKDFLEFIKNDLAQNTDPPKKLKDLNEKRKKIEGLKKKYLQELNPDEFNKAILNLASEVVWGKPRRKDLQSKSYYHLEKLHREIARRLSLSLDQVRSIPYEKIKLWLEKGQADEDLINSIRRYNIIVPNDDSTLSVLHGKEANEFDKLIERRKDQEDYSQLSEVKGNCACPGKVTGRVKVINLPQEMGKMNQGDILVSIATTPSLVPAMKKAAAIVTNEGGLTCHAAIVSRELNLPGVIGTNIATKVFKDNDLVEVDAAKGIVRKI